MASQLASAAKLGAFAPSALPRSLAHGVSTSVNTALPQRTPVGVAQCSAQQAHASESSKSESRGVAAMGRRQLGLAVVLSTVAVGADQMGLVAESAWAALPPSNDEEIKLCNAECEQSLEQFPLQTTASGLQYRDIVVGKGPSPPVGFQVAADYVAMIPTGRVFDSSLEKKQPYIFRVGSGQVIAGLDEGIMTMAVGGLRRLYIPGELAFTKGLPSAPGRPRVSPASPVMFDVKLLYIPGLEDFEDDDAAVEEESLPEPLPSDLLEEDAL